MDEKISYMFDWIGDDYMWCELPDGNINHCKSDEYPLEEWFEAEHLSTDLIEPKVIIEDHYSE